MATIKIAGQAIVVESALQLDDIIKVGKYRPEALILKEDGDDGKKVPVFAIAGNYSLKGCINDNGAEFGCSNTEGNAIITILAPDLPEDDDPKGTVADLFGVAIARLNALEAAMPGVIEGIDAAKAKVVEAITIA